MPLSYTYHIYCMRNHPNKTNKTYGRSIGELISDILLWIHTHDVLEFNEEQGDQQKLTFNSSERALHAA